MNLGGLAFCRGTTNSRADGRLCTINELVPDIGNDVEGRVDAVGIIDVACDTACWVSVIRMLDD